MRKKNNLRVENKEKETELDVSFIVCFADVMKIEKNTATLVFFLS